MASSLLGFSRKNCIKHVRISRKNDRKPSQYFVKEWSKICYAFCERMASSLLRILLKIAVSLLGTDLWKNNGKSASHLTTRMFHTSRKNDRKSARYFAKEWYQISSAFHEKCLKSARHFAKEWSQVCSAFRKRMFSSLLGNSRKNRRKSARHFAKEWPQVFQRFAKE